MKRERLYLEISILVVMFSFFSSPAFASPSKNCGLLPFNICETGVYLQDLTDAILETNPARSIDVLLFAGGGGSGYKGGYKGSGKNRSYKGAKESGANKGSKASRGFKEPQGKTGNAGGKGARDELNVEKNKNEKTVQEKELVPHQENH